MYPGVSWCTHSVLSTTQQISLDGPQSISSQELWHCHWDISCSPSSQLSQRCFKTSLNTYNTQYPADRDNHPPVHWSLISYNRGSPSISACPNVPSHKRPQEKKCLGGYGRGHDRKKSCVATEAEVVGHCGQAVMVVDSPSPSDGCSIA